MGAPHHEMVEGGCLLSWSRNYHKVRFGVGENCPSAGAEVSFTPHPVSFCVGRWGPTSSCSSLQEANLGLAWIKSCFPLVWLLFNLYCDRVALIKYCSLAAFLGFFLIYCRIYLLSLDIRSVSYCTDTQIGGSLHSVLCILFL